MDFIELIKTRRSVRKYKDTPVDDATIKEIIECGLWAPSWANTQCWRFVIINDQEIKKKLATAVKETNPAYNALLQAPVVIAACGVKGISGFYKGQASTDKGDWYMFDVALAVQNIALTAHYKGLATVQIGLFDSIKAKEILNLPQELELIELIPLGYPDGEAKVPRRKEFEEVVTFNSF